MKKLFVVANRLGSEPKDASRLVRVVVRVGILTDVSRFQSCRALTSTPTIEDFPKPSHPPSLSLSRT